MACAAHWRSTVLLRRTESELLSRNACNSCPLEYQCTLTLVSCASNLSCMTSQPPPKAPCALLTRLRYSLTTIHYKHGDKLYSAFTSSLLPSSSAKASPRRHRTAVYTLDLLQGGSESAVPTSLTCDQLTKKKRREREREEDLILGVL